MENYAQSISEKDPDYAVQLKVLAQTTSQNLSFSQIRSNIFEGMKAYPSLAAKGETYLKRSSMRRALQFVYLSHKVDLYLEAYKQGRAEKHGYADLFLTVSDLNLSPAEFYSQTIEALCLSNNLRVCEMLFLV